ncbi:MAG: hypothetical protein DRQ88_11550 [Epsilonproteobacteria bacterium]|nr:MAG: hypothetical protein DRQ88_11550 [Campylobacterota bacterium]
MEKNKELITDIDPVDCELSEFNTRQTYDVEAIDKLAERMKTHGFEMTRALWCNEENGKYKVFAGGCRLQAAKKAHIKVAVLNHVGFTEEEIVHLSDYDNECDEYHLPVHWIEELKSYARLRDKGWTQERIGKAKNRSHGRVSHKIRIYDEILNNPQVSKNVDLVRQVSLKESHLDEILALFVAEHFKPWLSTDMIRLEFIQKTIHDIKKNGEKTHKALRADVKTFKNMLIKAEAIYAELDEEITLYELVEEGGAVIAKPIDFHPKEEFITRLGEEKARTLSEVVAASNALKKEIEENLSTYTEFMKTKTKISEEDKKISELQKHFVCGDGLKGVEILEDKSITLLLTDPPYGIEYQSNRRWKTEAPKKIMGDTEEESLALITDLLAAVKPKLKDNAHMLIFCDWRREPDIRQIIKDAGYKIRSLVVWVKEEHSAGDVKGAFAPRHEFIIHATQGNPTIHPRKPDVFEIPRVGMKKRKHPNQKPVKLLTELIEACTTKGDLVIDPFAGVASTLVAANLIGREFRGWELTEEYHGTGMERLIAEIKKEVIVGASNGKKTDN